MPRVSAPSASTPEGVRTDPRGASAAAIARHLEHLPSPTEGVETDRWRVDDPVAHRGRLRAWFEAVAGHGGVELEAALVDWLAFHPDEHVALAMKREGLLAFGGALDSASRRALATVLLFRGRVEANREGVLWTPVLDVLADRGAWPIWPDETPVRAEGMEGFQIAERMEEVRGRRVIWGPETPRRSTGPTVDAIARPVGDWARGADPGVVREALTFESPVLHHVLARHATPDPAFVDRYLARGRGGLEALAHRSTLPSAEGRKVIDRALARGRERGLGGVEGRKRADWGEALVARSRHGQLPTEGELEELVAWAGRRPLPQTATGHETLPVGALVVTRLHGLEARWLDRLLDAMDGWPRQAARVASSPSATPSHVRRVLAEHGPVERLVEHLLVVNRRMLGDAGVRWALLEGDDRDVCEAVLDHVDDPGERCRAAARIAPTHPGLARRALGEALRGSVDGIRPADLAGLLEADDARVRSAALTLLTRVSRREREGRGRG